MKSKMKYDDLRHRGQRSWRKGISPAIAYKIQALDEGEPYNNTMGNHMSQS